jgi:hypothetical protein
VNTSFWLQAAFLSVCPRSTGSYLSVCPRSTGSYLSVCPTSTGKVLAFASVCPRILIVCWYMWFLLLVRLGGDDKDLSQPRVRHV